DEDVVEGPEWGDLLVVPAGGEEPADVLAVAALIDDLGRRQVRLGREEQPDDVLEVGAIGGGAAADPPDGRAVAEEQDPELPFLGMRGRGRHRQEGEETPGTQGVHAPHPTDSPVSGVPLVRARTVEGPNQPSGQSELMSSTVRSVRSWPPSGP